MKRIYLIDCPGVVPPDRSTTEADILLRGVVRVENVEHPEQYMAAVLKKVKPHHMERTYGLKGYNSHTEFLEMLARKGGRLLKGGEADLDGVAKMVLNDFIRGKIPWFTPPPVAEGENVKGIEGRLGNLGEMGKKRKREEDISTIGDDSNVIEPEDEISDDEDEDDEFSRFNSEEDDEDSQDESEAGLESNRDTRSEKE